MIRGMSYPQGVFYMDKDYIAHAMMDEQGKIQTKLMPFDSEGLVFFMKRTLLTIPLYFVIGMLALIIWVWSQPGFPFYWILLGVFGYHFVFPFSLKQYHGAEHKVFSHQGKKSYHSLHAIQGCSIVNRHCSTNGVVTFLLLFLLAFYPLGPNGAAVLSLIGVWVVPRWMKPIEEKVIFPLSAILQKRITTLEPTDQQLKVALFSYLTLIRKEEVTEELLLEEIRMEEEKKREEERKAETERVIRDTEWLEI